MALTEKQEYKVEIIPPFNVLQVRRADIIMKDGAGGVPTPAMLFPLAMTTAKCDCVKSGRCFA